MRFLCLLMSALLAATGFVALFPRHSQRTVASRAFDCVLPITVSVSGHPVVTTPTICVPGPVKP